MGLRQQGIPKMEQSNPDILALAAQIVSAHVEHNEIASDALPGLIREVYQTLAAVDPSKVAEAGTRAQIGASVAADHLTCLECGMTMKMLKRHLITVHGLTPADYREKWNLSADYPMVASNYAELRSKLAKESGLGKRPEGRGRWR